MNGAAAHRGLSLGMLWLVACVAADGGEGEPVEVGLAAAALSPCGEMVPENRAIDGIPAYAQCAETESSAIYSNNGVDTATTAQGPDWVRTQYSGGYQCTELANRYLHFKWGVRWRPRGNAGQWCDTMPPADSGVVQTMTPVHGDIMVLAPGSCGAAQSTGHVTVVDVVDAASGRLTVVEQNRARRGMYMQSCAKCFLHVVANDGTNTGASIPPSGAPAAGAPAAAGSPAPQPEAAGARSEPPRGRPQAPAGAPAPMTPASPAAPPAAGPDSGAAGAGLASAAGRPAPVPPAAPPAPATTSQAGAQGLASSDAIERRTAESEAGGCSAAGTRSAPAGASWVAVLATALVLSLRRRRSKLVR